MRYVIAGAGPAGISAAKTLRQLDRDGEIVLVSKDDQVHSRCMLHKYLGGERDAEGISFIPPGFFKQNNITWCPESNGPSAQAHEAFHPRFRRSHTSTPSEYLQNHPEVP